jgi:hypothetical protein
MSITPKQAYEAAKVLWPGTTKLQKHPLGWYAKEIQSDGRLLRLEMTVPYCVNARTANVFGIGSLGSPHNDCIIRAAPKRLDQTNRRCGRLRINTLFPVLTLQKIFQIISRKCV